ERHAERDEGLLQVGRGHFPIAAPALALLIPIRTALCPMPCRVHARINLCLSVAARSRRICEPIHTSRTFFSDILSVAEHYYSDRLNRFSLQLTAGRAWQ